MGKYGIGARVRVTGAWGSVESGDTGTVADTPGRNACINAGFRGVTIHRLGDEYYIPKRLLKIVVEDAGTGAATASEPASASPEKGDLAFSVGDRVRAAGSCEPSGEVGRVAALDGGWLLVDFDTWRHGHDGVDVDGDTGHSKWFVDPENLVAEAPPEPVAAAEPQPKFKVGDRVNWTRSRGSWQGAEIVDIASDALLWPIYLKSDLGTGCFPADELELATPTFSIGDTVAVTGIITRTLDLDGEVLVEFDNGTASYFQPSQFAA